MATGRRWLSSSLRSGSSISDGDVDEICRLRAEDCLTLKQACAIVGVDYKSFLELTREREGRVRHPEWRVKKERATAECARKVLNRGFEYADKKNTAGVKWCESMMRTIDPENWGEKKQTGTGMVVNILTSESARPIDCKVVTVEPKALPGGN